MSLFLYLSDDRFAACPGPSLSFIFFANFQGFFSYSCYFGDLDNIYLQLPIKFTFAAFAFFHAVFVIYRLLYLGFLVILLYNENPCHNFYCFAYSIRFLIFLLLTSSLLKFLQDFSF